MTESVWQHANTTSVEKQQRARTHWKDENIGREMREKANGNWERDGRESNGK
jgi:hypothetical protein